MSSLGWLAQPAAFPWVALVVGLCIGSFLNVVIHRLPRMMEREWLDQIPEMLDEAEVDDAVEALSSLMEPMIMVVLGTLIGGMVIAMYLPIFKMGQAV